MANTKSPNITTVLATDTAPEVKGPATFQYKIGCSRNLHPFLAQTVYDLAVPGD